MATELWAEASTTWVCLLLCCPAAFLRHHGRLAKPHRNEAHDVCQILSGSDASLVMYSLNSFCMETLRKYMMQYLGWTHKCIRGQRAIF